jgi:arabinose-5-phosphate isomerase
VIDAKGELLGLVTDYDIRRALELDRDLFSMKITEIMTPKPLAVADTAKASEALDLMKRRKKPIAILPVVDAAGKVVGMVHLHDFLAAGL